MNHNAEPAPSHSGQDHAQGGSCCGGGNGATAKPTAAPAAKTAANQTNDAKTKPAGSSGCCGG